MKQEQLPLGIHHVTAITSDVVKNYEFFTNILGMRLLKKSVNQDDIHTYHTYYGDDEGTPGTAMTFFDFPNIPKGIKGNNAITRTSFRVPNDASLTYYKKRFEEFGVTHDDITEEFGVKVLHFSDFDDQNYQLISDENNQGMRPGTPWKKGPVPAEFAIYGLGPVEITISYFKDFKEIFEALFTFKEIAQEGNRYLLEVGEGGNGAQVILVEDKETPNGREGYGEVHHFALRVKDTEAIYAWKEQLDRAGFGNSGHVERFYFESLYVRIGHVLVEFATDAPGFMADEPYETLGESLALPPFLEPNRAYIESQVKPFNTKREA